MRRKGPQLGRVGGKHAQAWDVAGAGQGVECVFKKAKFLVHSWQPQLGGKVKARMRIWDDIVTVGFGRRKERRRISDGMTGRGGARRRCN